MKKGVKDAAFNRVIILKSADVANNNPGNTMTYLNADNQYHLPTIRFYGYYSAVEFTTDEIHYTMNGPMGSFSTTDYDGVKL